MIVNLIGLLTHTVAPPPTPLAPNPTPSFSLDGSWSIQDQNQPNYTRKFTYKFFEPFPAEKCPCIDPIDPNDPSPPSIRFAPLEDPTDPTPETEPKTAAGAETQPPTDAITSNSISSASSVTSATTSTPFKPTSTPLVSSTETSPDASPLHDGDSALGNGKEEKDEEKAKHCVTPKVVEELVTEMEGTTQETTLETTLETTQEKTTQEKTTQEKTTQESTPSLVEGTFAQQPFADGGVTHPHLYPIGGTYRGHFTNAPKKAGRVTERFTLFFNTAAPSPGLDATRTAPLTAVEVGGTGQNKFGVFTLTGWYDPTSRQISLKRIYVSFKFVPESMIAKVLTLSHSSHRPRLKAAEGGGQGPPLNAQNKDGSMKTRKKRMSWQRSDGGDPWGDGGEVKVKRRSKSLGADGSEYAGPASVALIGLPGEQQEGVLWEEEQYAALAPGRKKKGGFSDGGFGNPHHADYPSQYQQLQVGGGGRAGGGGGGGMGGMKAQFQLPTHQAVRLPPPSLPDSDLYLHRCAHYYKGVEEIYEGDMLESKRHGLGVHLYRNGNVYRGGFKGDKEHGRGALWNESGKVVFEGDFFQGKITGTGTYRWEDGSHYTGEFSSNTRSGWGTYYFPSGATYAGEWKEGSFWGKGRFTFGRTDEKEPGSEYYDGEWLNGQRHGKGSLKLDDYEYVGQWAMDKIEGRGRATYDDKSVFDGQFHLGAREGRGTVEWPNGATYEGRFRQDLIEGVGTCTILKSVVADSLADSLADSASDSVKEEEVGSSSGGGSGGGDKDQEFIIPICVSDLENIHQRAGFTSFGG